MRPRPSGTSLLTPNQTGDRWAAVASPSVGCRGSPPNGAGSLQSEASDASPDGPLLDGSARLRPRSSWSLSASSLAAGHQVHARSEWQGMEFRATGRGLRRHFVIAGVHQEATDAMASKHPGRRRRPAVAPCPGSHSLIPCRRSGQGATQDALRGCEHAVIGSPGQEVGRLVVTARCSPDPVDAASSPDDRQTVLRCLTSVGPTCSLGVSCRSSRILGASIDEPR